MKKYSTKQMLDIITGDQSKTYEVAMDNGYFRATHMLEVRNNVIYDVGIDSQTVKWKVKDFNIFYNKAFWTFDQIIALHD